MSSLSRSCERNNSSANLGMISAAATTVCAAHGTVYCHTAHPCQWLDSVNMLRMKMYGKCKSGQWGLRVEFHWKLMTTERYYYCQTTRLEKVQGTVTWPIPPNGGEFKISDVPKYLLNCDTDVLRRSLYLVNLTVVSNESITNTMAAIMSFLIYKARMRPEQCGRGPGQSKQRCVCDASARSVSSTNWSWDAATGCLNVSS